MKLELTKKQVKLICDLVEEDRNKQLTWAEAQERQLLLDYLQAKLQYSP